MKMKYPVMLTLIIATIVLAISCELTGENGVAIPGNIITSFSIDSLGAGVEIDGNDINVAVPNGTTLTAVVVDFSITGISIHVGGVEQVSGVTINDFTNPITFTVTGSDGTTRDYTVTVRLGGGARLFSPDFVGGTFATFRGDAYSQGYVGGPSSPIIDMGICYNTTGNPDIGDSIRSFAAGGPEYLEFEGDIDPISENTVYYIRSFVTTAEGTVYSPEQTFDSGYAIGANHAGGLVYYNNGSGGGRVAATANQDAGSGSPWIAGGSTATTYNPGAISEVDGLANSLAIVAQAGHTSSAAELCLDYSVGSYGDWYLPSKYELVEMMYNLTHYALSPDFAGSYFWSSTGDRTAAYGDQYAWHVYGTYSEFQSPDYWGKSASFKVRAISSF